MVGYAMLFGVFALFAAAFGFGGIGGGATELARTAFALCTIAAITLLLVAQVKRFRS